MKVSRHLLLTVLSRFVTQLKQAINVHKEKVPLYGHDQMDQKGYL
ncbi:MAG: hypothetical protein ACJAUX_000417 [Flavobacteriales bacterium]|jgi:hypothetical protein